MLKKGQSSILVSGKVNTSSCPAPALHFVKKYCFLYDIHAPSSKGRCEMGGLISKYVL